MCAPYGNGFCEERSVDICQRVLNKAEELAAPAALGDLSGKRINELLNRCLGEHPSGGAVRPPSDLPPGVSIFNEHINPSNEGGEMTGRTARGAGESRRGYRQTFALAGAEPEAAAGTTPISWEPCGRSTAR